MATLTITDEPTRWTLEAALWYHAAARVGEGDFYDDLLASSNPRLAPDGDPASAAETIDTLQDVQSAVDRVRNAAEGETVELPASANELVSCLQSSKQAIQEYESLFQLPPGEREKMLAIHDTAARLLAELQPAAVA